MNVEYFLQLIKQGKNPEQLMLNFLQTQMSSNPVGANLLQLAQNNNTAGIEQFARNLCTSKGLDFDKEFTNFKNNLKL